MSFFGNETVKLDAVKDFNNLISYKESDEESDKESFKDKIRKDFLKETSGSNKEDIEKLILSISKPTRHPELIKILKEFVNFEKIYNSNTEFFNKVSEDTVAQSNLKKIILELLGEIKTDDSKEEKKTTTPIKSTVTDTKFFKCDGINYDIKNTNNHDKIKKCVKDKELEQLCKDKRNLIEQLKQKKQEIQNQPGQFNDENSSFSETRAALENDQLDIETKIEEIKKEENDITNGTKYGIKIDDYTCITGGKKKRGKSRRKKSRKRHRKNTRKSRNKRNTKRRRKNTRKSRKKRKTKRRRRKR